jgi:hypothetical protein
MRTLGPWFAFGLPAGFAAAALGLTPGGTLTVSERLAASVLIGVLGLLGRWLVVRGNNTRTRLRCERDVRICELQCERDLKRSAIEARTRLRLAELRLRGLPARSDAKDDND